jgi:hypothetical protein
MRATPIGEIGATRPIDRWELDRKRMGSALFGNNCYTAPQCRQETRRRVIHVATSGKSKACVNRIQVCGGQ